MKYLFLSSILALIIFSCGNRQQVRVIEFEVYNTSEYCGGAAPSDEILDELKTPRKTTDTLYVNAGPDRHEESMMLILKDGKGKLTGVVNGDYNVYRHSTEEIKKLEMSPDPKAGCYMNFYSTPCMHFEIWDETKVISDTFLVTCDPCADPMP